MKIGIKVSPLTVLKAGIPNYILNLLRAMGEIDRNSSFFLYTNKPLSIDHGLPPNFIQKVVRFPSPSLQLWYQIGLPIQLRRDGVELFHDPVYPLPFALGIPGVITVHDLSNYTRPGDHKLRSVLGGRFFPFYLRKAAAIITDSHFTASELVRVFPGTSGKITVNHLGVSNRFRPVTDSSKIAGLKNRYELPERFMLFLGTLEPRKNIHRLLSAYEQAGDASVPLVITGGLGWKYHELLDLIRNHPRASKIHVTGFVKDEDLPTLLSAAEFLVYPSLLEGFGLPILESMACATPVLTSNVSSLPEVAGDAAYLVDPLSVDSIANGILELSSNGNLRAALSSKGLKRAAEFSWADTARKTLEIYKRVLSPDE